ncbi:hypothetical protein ACLOJK_018325 [Asimina triloba]
MCISETVVTHTKILYYLNNYRTLKAGIFSLKKMREKNNKTVVLNNNPKRSASREKIREKKLNTEKDNKISNTKKGKSETLDANSHSKVSVSNSKAGTDTSEVYEDVHIDYVDDYQSEVAITDEKLLEMVEEKNGDERNDPLSDQHKEVKQGSEGESDCETFVDSVSSQGDAETNKDVVGERVSRVPKSLPKKQFEGLSQSAKTINHQKEESRLQFKSPQSASKKSLKTNKITANGMDNQIRNMKVHPKPSSESSEGSCENRIEEVKEMDILNEVPNSSHIFKNDDEAFHAVEAIVDEGKVNMEQRIQDMKVKIEKLEEELREIAALEISLYSVVPEHGSSAHEIHTPARRLSRLYIHACKHWTQNKRASIARNTVSGLVLVARSCGSDVPRLTFWWSNIIVLRKIISQAFGNSHQSTMIGKFFESSEVKRGEKKFSAIKGKAGLGSKHANKLGVFQFADDWQEMGTFTAALEKIESWIFSRIIESVWWQSPGEKLYTVKGPGKLLGPALGDWRQGNFSINLWKSAFSDVFQRLCPARAGGHECGCVPVLAKMVMEQCAARLDVAMFNAIMRESENEIPTDPVSDPIVDSKVLPVPAGHLSFGSGAQLKNSLQEKTVAKWLIDLVGIDADDFVTRQNDHEDDDRSSGDAESKNFPLLNTLSDLLMLPKDMLLDRSIRKEVCPSFGLPLIKRILCNFTPDEFCPDPVPGSVLEELNFEPALIIMPLGLRVRPDYNAPRLLDLGGNGFERPDSLLWVPQCDIVRFGACLTNAHQLPPDSSPNHTYWRDPALIPFVTARPDYNAPRPRGYNLGSGGQPELPLQLPRASRSPFLGPTSLLERRKSEEGLIISLPCTAAPIIYNPPLLANEGEKMADAGRQAPQLEQTLSVVQSRGYTSDEDMDGLEFPLTSIVGKSDQSHGATNGNGKHGDNFRPNGEGVRYTLLREVWAV